MTLAISVNNYLFNLEVKEEQFSSNTDYSSYWNWYLFFFHLQDYIKTNIYKLAPIGNASIYSFHYSLVQLIKPYII